MLVSSAASAGPSLVYAAEKNQTATTAEKNTKNSEAISNENTLTQKQNLTATERKTVNPSNFDWNIGEVLPSTPTNNYSGTLPNTVRGATFQITFSIFKQPSSVKANVALLNHGEADFTIEVLLTVFIKDMPKDEAIRFVEEADQVCPYSKALRGNVTVNLEISDTDF